MLNPNAGLINVQLHGYHAYINSVYLYSINVCPVREIYRPPTYETVGYIIGNDTLVTHEWGQGPYH